MQHMAPDTPGPQRHRRSSGSQRPFLRWAGGKRWFVQHYAHLIPNGFDRYVEPFLGSGAVYFHLGPQRAILTDANCDLITAFRGIRARPVAVMRHLTEHQRRHSAAYYRQIRASNPPLLSERAARIIYLNRTCFNGVYRVNLHGRFNVPMGDRSTIVYDTDDFRSLARTLGDAELGVADFETTIDRTGYGDLVYADPPYTVRHNNNGFIKYNETLFSWDDQERLAKCLTRAAERGVKVLATNAAHDSVRELYADHGFTLTEVSRFSPIAASARDRKQYTEIVISTT
ncbi:Dam family site-specific DNA-(adenine-N6)-methyltransferase [Glycomyces sp. YM15]|uniref:DNA adenine methylase n=1 Tax=Glycomyces sp. YM15 TaxID=2800446 RepID=UPI00196542B0|nr:Dam family site-specific DNA-(adenine-N6)-methyltransferase [Glycomyces sp. YM15]